MHCPGCQMYDCLAGGRRSDQPPELRNHVLTGCGTGTSTGIRGAGMCLRELSTVFPGCVAAPADHKYDLR